MMQGDWGLLFIIIQACGLAALVIQNAALLLPCGKKIMQVQAISAFLWACHYGLRGLENIAYMCLSGVVGNLVSSKANKSFLVKYNIFHSFVLISFLFITMTQTSDIWPIIICMLAYVRCVSRDNLLRFHSCGLICAIMWTCYHFAFSSWFGVVNDGIVTITTAIALFKIISAKKLIPQPLPA